MKLNAFICAKLKKDEFESEKLINKFRFITAFLYSGVTVLFAVLRRIEGLEPFPAYGLIPSNIFLLFPIFIYFYLKKRKAVHDSFKYICVIFDMTIISVSIYVGCSYPHIDPPISYLSIWALFYTILIMLGAFRYSVRCAVFSGIYAGLCYLIVVILRVNALDLPYFAELGGSIIKVRFPLYNELLRLIIMALTGVITGIICKHRVKLFSSMVETQDSSSKVTFKIMKQTQDMAFRLKKSTSEINLSSKEIFATANNQAASIQEIEATINENTRIASDIADKTSTVASIAQKMENDVNNGFSILERNVSQLEEIRNRNDGVISGIIELGNKIQKIRDIIESIYAITDQTKVIAFNAALEAASAGEYGKRFSVVSSEVNRLADDIAAMTKEIRKQADDIHKSSSSLIISGKDSAGRITDGNKLIRELEDIFRDIRVRAEETADQVQTITVSAKKQQYSTEQINTAIADISKGLSNFINSTQTATSCAEKLSFMIQELGTILIMNSEAHS